MNHIHIFFILLFLGNLLSASTEQYKQDTTKIGAITVNRYSRVKAGITKDELKIVHFFIESEKINTKKETRIAIITGEKIVESIRLNYPSRIEHDYTGSINGNRRKIYCFYEVN